MREARWYDRSGALKSAAIGVLAIAAIILGSFALARSNPSTPTDSQAAFRTVTPITKHPTAVFLGGTFTKGAGATTTSKSWPSLISRARGWKIVNIASQANDIFAPTGSCPASGCIADSAIVAAVVSAAPRVVVIGAQVDPKSNPKTVAATVAATVHAIRLAIPSVYIVGVGPVATPGTDDTRVQALDSAFRSIAASNSAVYVSLLSPTGLDSSQFAADGSGPNDSGQAQIAQRIQASLSS